MLLAALVCDGLGLIANTKAAVVRLGLAEMIAYSRLFYPGKSQHLMITVIFLTIQIQYVCFFNDHEYVCICGYVSRHSQRDVSTELRHCRSDHFVLQWQDTSDGGHVHQSRQLQSMTSCLYKLALFFTLSLRTCSLKVLVTCFVCMFYLQWQLKLKQILK